MECLTSFVLETKIKKTRIHITKATSLVENILNKLLILLLISKIQEYKYTYIYLNLIYLQVVIYIIVYSNIFIQKNFSV